MDNKLEYIPGDLVMTNGVPCGTANDVVYRVTLSDPSRTFEFDDGTELKGVVRLENLEGVEFGDKGFLFGDCCAWVKDIVPIPLVPAILEKNGWKHKKEFGEYWFVPRNEDYELLALDKVGEEWAIYIEENSSNFENIKYVHQLQHLLFGLNINHEMEV